MLILKRPYSIYHTALIPHSISTDEIEFANLVSNIFEILRADYHTTENLEIKTKLSNIFYNKIYKPPMLTRGDPTGHEVSISEFLNEAILYVGEKDRNRYIFLTGDYGIGKTTFVNWLITTQFKDFVDNYKMWFIRLDLEHSIHANLYSPQSIFFEILQTPGYLYDENKNYFKVGSFNEKEAKILNEISPHESLKVTHYKAFRKLVRQIGQDGQRLVIIIDNIDYFCHIQDRNVFIDLPKSEDFRLLKNLVDLIKSFFISHIFKHIGANIVFVMRYQTYQIFKFIKTFSLNNTPFGESLSYFLHPPDFVESVTNKCELLQQYTSKYLDKETKKEKYGRIIHRIKDDLSSLKTSEKGSYIFSAGLLEILNRITNSGLRQVMEFFGQYGWIGSDRKYGKVPRFLHSVPVGVLTFILNKYKRFSQKYSQFPNIFLVSSLTEIQKAKQSSDDEYKLSYWLKYLVLKFINSQQFSRLPELLRVFEDGYRNKLIRKVLGDLYDLNMGFCITVGRNWNDETEVVEIDDIRITERGALLANHHFLFSFVYLQLIVDDPDLILPQFLNDLFDFENIGRERYDYSYVTHVNEEEYFRRANEMIIYKSQLVVLFLILLRRSFEKEMSIHRKVFNVFQEEEIELPDFQLIEDNLLNEFEMLNQILSKKIDINYLERLKKKYERKIEKWVDDVYSRY